MTVVSAPALLVGTSITGPGAVVVDDGVITDVLHHVPAPAPDHLQLTDGVLTAGMVDLQVNGAFGVDVAGAGADGWATMRRALAGTGVTSFVPTLITAAVDDLADRIDAIGAARATEVPGGSRLLGAHLEGPFLSPLRAGAHDADLMVAPTDAILDTLLAQGRDATTVLVTLAPELPGALTAASRLAAAGIVVSIGHTDALAAEVAAGLDAGATMVTHLFNAQRGLDHREPGVPGVALTDPRCTVGLIADLHHVAGPVVRLVFAAAPGRVALVTDAVAAAGMPPGEYDLGGRPAVVARQGDPPRRPDGTLAGSTLTLDRAVRTVVALGIDRAAALLAATATPADVLGRPDLGRLDPGAAADLVHWDDHLQVARVWIGGRQVR